MENKGSMSSLEEISKTIRIFIKHLKLIITTTIIFTGIFTVAVLYVVKPKYQASSEIIVNQKLDKDAQVTEQQQVQTTDLQLVNTYKSVLNSQTVGDSVRKKVGNGNYKDSSLSVTTDTSSQVININVISHNAKNAARIANETAKVFKDKIKNIMNVNNVSIISKAHESNQAISPKKGLSVIIGFIVGIIVGMFLSLFKEHNDKTIQDRSFIENELGLVDLGVISDIDMKNIKKQIKRK
ncbi:chain-length determining protein [Apilactobacillus kunkeei]|uniref:YveK family protein n=1 Tax=Apilactobacillus kunkeei TaxID=148814 RepID=UPI00110D2480|nr:Wzz/FepE/Etk N-terminal domain-containing protein [Apilactobacillus kunkeei]TMT01285.1 chain-length determining protein [Apilactobacillus kunkeei]